MNSLGVNLFFELGTGLYTAKIFVTGEFGADSFSLTSSKFECINEKENWKSQ